MRMDGRECTKDASQLLNFNLLSISIIGIFYSYDQQKLKEKKAGAANTEDVIVILINCFFEASTVGHHSPWTA